MKKAYLCTYYMAQTILSLFVLYGNINRLLYMKSDNVDLNFRRKKVLYIIEKNNLVSDNLSPAKFLLIAI